MADTNPEVAGVDPQIVFSIPGTGDALLELHLPFQEKVDRVGIPVDPLKEFLQPLPEGATVWLQIDPEDNLKPPDVPLISVIEDRIIIDTESRRIKIDNEEVHFSKKEHDLLLLLARRFGKVVTRNEIVVEVWGQDYLYQDHPGESTKVHIARIRKKLGKDLREHLEVIREVGYRLSE